MDNRSELTFEFEDLQKQKIISPRRQRAMQFLQSLSKKLGRRSQNDLIYNSQEELPSSSTDSFSLSLAQTEKSLRSSSIDFSSISTASSSCNMDKFELEEDHQSATRTPLKRLHLNRISISSVGKVLQSLSSSSRSLSCNNTPLKSQNKKPVSKPTKQNQQPQTQPQRILRQPVNYVYLKGMSGLPTRRVPRSSLCCTYAYR